MSINYHVIGANIKNARKKSGLTQETLAELVNKSPCYISYIENGKKHLSLETFVAISNVLSVSADELLSFNSKCQKSKPHAFVPFFEEYTAHKQKTIFELVNILCRELRDAP